MNPFALFTDALLAYSVHEHQLGHVKRIDLRVQPRAFTIQDDGRGMGLDRPGYVESLLGLLAGAAGEVQLHGIALAIIAAASPRLTVESRRGDHNWMQCFAWGIAEAPPTQGPAGPARGTRVTVELPADAAVLDVETVRAQAARWQAAHPGLAIEVHGQDARQ